MRICHVIDYFHTDVGYQEYYLALEHARAGHDVHVISSTFRQHTVGVPGPDEELGARELALAGVDLIRLPSRQLGHDRTWMRGLRGALVDLSPDFVHVHGPFSPTTPRAVAAARAAGAHTLVDNHVHELIAPGSERTIPRTVYRAYRMVVGPYLRSRVGQWVANGPLEGAFLARRLGIPPQQVHLVPLGFDTGVFGWTPERRRRARISLGVDDSTTVISVTGKIHAGKRPEVTAAAAEKLASRVPVALVLAGQIEPDALRMVEVAAPELKERGLLINRGMLGRSDLADLFHGSDVVVFARLPSISIYEAAGTGAEVLVGRDPFSEWLNTMCPSVVPVDVSGPDWLDPVAVGPVPDEVRGRRAAQAKQAFGWPVVAADFISRYDRIRGSRPTRDEAK